MADDGKKPEMTIGSGEADMTYLLVLTALILELKASGAINGENLAKRMERYVDKVPPATESHRRMVNFFLDLARE